MRVNFNFEVTDEQRDIIRTRIEGKVTQQLATREMLCDFLQGCLDSLAQPEPEKPLVTRAQLSKHEADQVEKLRAEGKDESYIRGWVQVGRKQV